MTFTKSKGHGSILRQSADGWQITAASSEPSTWHAVHGRGAVDAGLLAKQAAEFVASHGLSKSVALAIDSRSTFAARFTTDSPAELRDRRLLGYKVEELLPVAAEDFAADYVNEGNEVLGVATPIRDLLPIVTGLEEQGLQVQSISPTVILALQSFFEESGKPSCDLLLWQNGSSVELFDVGQRIRDWRHLPAEPLPLVQQIGARLLQTPGNVKIALLDVDDELRQALERLEQVELHVVDSQPIAELARRGGALALTGKRKPWAELRQGKLMAGDPHRAIRVDGRRCLWAAAILLLSLATFFWMRSRQYAGQIEAIQEKQEDLYRQVFPDTRVPNAIASRLKSEHRKLMGARGNDAAVEQPASALNVLHELVTGMPEDVRLQVQQIRIDDGKIDVDLNVRTVGDAGELADALQNHGFAIEPPTTEKLDPKSVTVRINGKLENELREVEP